MRRCLKQRPTAALVFTVLFLVFTAIPASAQRGAMTVSMNLEQLVDEAGTIVEGYVRGWRAEPHPRYEGLRTVVVTLRVSRTLKGEPAENLTFRQYIWDIRDSYDGAGYKKGQRMILMLIPVNENGLTSPPGMHQGRFRIQTNADGEEFAVNGNGNATLFRNLSTEASGKVSAAGEFTQYLDSGAGGAMPLETLRAMILSLVEVAQ